MVLYSHGTGGNAGSHIRDGTAASLAGVGIATFGFDQLFNGRRIVPNPDGTAGSAEAQFFNFLNPTAGRTNNQQAAVDLLSAARMLRTLTLPADIAQSDQPVAFRGERLAFFGHSQGGLNGPLWLAHDDSAGAAVLSGAAGTLVLSMTQKTEPVDVPVLLALLLGIQAGTADEIVPQHPILTIAQTAVEASDPVNFARRLVREPPSGLRGKHLYMTQGFIDRYAPPDAIAALGLSIGLQLVGPVVRPIRDYDLLELPPASAPLQGNLMDGTLTAALQQFNAPRGRDGHYVIFSVPEARARATGFLRSYMDSAEAPPTIP